MAGASWCAAACHAAGLQLARLQLRVPAPAEQQTRTPDCFCTSQTKQPSRQALTAWNSRLWRRAQQAAEREPAAAAAAAAAALQLLPAARSGAANAGGGGLGVLVPWAVSECWLRPLLQHPAVAHAVAVEPSADGAEQISAAFALAPPNGVAHDGRERYTDRAAVSTAAAVVTAHPTVAAAAATTAAAAVAAAGGQQRQEQRWASKRLLLYRGNGFALTPPVLSLALDFTVVWDR